jgi:hypothetical protein
MRSSLTFTLISLIAAAACGGSDPAPDAPENGFNPPTAVLKANIEVTDNNWMEIGDANLTCLNTPNADQATAQEVMLDTTVKDFQNGTVVPNAMVTAFNGIDYMTPFVMGTSDATTGKVTLAIPMGTKRFGFKMTGEFMTTFLLNQTIKPDLAAQALTIQSVSNSTAATLPALIGQTRTPGTGVIAGALRDCAGHEMSNFVATVSSTQGTATPIGGADSFYFSPTVGLPQHHNAQPSASGDGLFMVIQIPPTDTAYVQMWGFPTNADLASNNMKLIAELKVPALADAVITGSYEPLRQ